MADFAVYSDTSGHPSNKPYVVMAAFASTENQWLDFTDEWNDALTELGIEKPFHMADFMSRMAKRKTKRELMLAILSGIIGKYVCASFISAVAVEDYKRLNCEFALEEAHGAPYAIAGRFMGEFLKKWETEHLTKNDHFLLFVEEGTYHRGDLEQVLRRDGLPTPHAVPKSLPAVQPADMLAWEAYNRLANPTQPPRDNLAALFSRGLPGCYGGLATEEDMRRMCVGQFEIRRDSLPQGTTVRFHSEPKRIRTRKVW
jgi:hypothetical protein